MTKHYDFKKAKNFILENKETIESADLGIREDWSWTAEEVYNDKDGFVIDLDTVEKIAGIPGSRWATPALLVVYKNGDSKLFDCHDGGNSNPMDPLAQAMMYGPLSGPTQEYVEDVEKGEF
ncbi:hypothetical protein B795N_00760 [Marinilactibacillus psychrotolerans]|uniref:hypothetical protein n=1 Tax=Marinilactibacillus psychrotolerans TaxID=191770 RepID=UPI001C7E04F4|nr:hypothetical protein [Marinilactibacillus psychrotolerans]GEQ32194.1 hypothetical protein B795N_00760 [Marinilactibacillus psychrotolerans]